MGNEFNSDDLVTSHQDSGVLEDDFSIEEINAIIVELPTDKSPGPDGFNNEFTRKCWSIIAHDIYDIYNSL